MSWDIFVQDIPSQIECVADIPDDWVPKTLGKRSELIARILEAVPTADFSRSDWGIIDGPDYLIEANMGESEDIESFAFHVRGGDQAAHLVARILKHLDLRAFDAASDTGIFSASPGVTSGPRSWRKYLGQILGKHSG